MEIVLNWISSNYIEVIGTLVSLVYLYFSINQKIWLWPLGLVSSAIYAYVFFVSKIYADMGLQLYYVAISAYGWYSWSMVNNEVKESTKVKSVTALKMIPFYLTLTSLFLFALLSQLLIHFTDSTIPYLDALTTALSIVATWMLAKRYIEHWLVWVVVDAMSSGIYLYKGLYFTVFLYVVYTMMAIIGFKAWMRELRIKPIVR